ncbi:MAG: GNAT family N-acetyltransferase [Ignavibacteria bacterium]|nr:GNAT family N-acetyltransferase [Ignavibacteria bacterium]
MNKLTVIKTKRLLLRQWKDSDLHYYASMNADEDVMHFFPRLQTEEESAAFIDVQLQRIDERGWGLFAVEVIESKEFIGFIGLNPTTFDSNFTPCTEIGWRLRKEFWNQGYASEGAKACLTYGFRDLDFKDIYSFTAKLNLPSERVMQKIGMEQIGEFSHPRVPEDSILKPHILYHLSQSKFNEMNINSAYNPNTKFSNLLQIQ